MIRCPDNQINASFIDILRSKWLVFYCGRLSSAQLVPLQAPKHRPIISLYIGLHVAITGIILNSKRNVV